MLCLLVTRRIKRKTLKEKLHLCKSQKIVQDNFRGNYGEINLYTVFYFNKKPTCIKRLKETVKEPLFTFDHPVPAEFSRKIILLKLLKELKQNPFKTVCLKEEFKESELLGEICRYSKKVYILSNSLDQDFYHIYKKYGTAPQLTESPVNCDFCPVLKDAYNINLPKELENICPKEFSALTIIYLIYAQNQKLII